MSATRTNHGIAQKILASKSCTILGFKFFLAKSIFKNTVIYISSKAVVKDSNILILFQNSIQFKKSNLVIFSVFKQRTLRRRSKNYSYVFQQSSKKLIIAKNILKCFNFYEHPFGVGQIMGSILGPTQTS